MRLRDCVETKSFVSSVYSRVCVCVCLAINAENAVHLSDKFATMAMKTREAMLRDLALNSTTSAVVDNSSRMGE
jgi:hypothetical protein